MRVLLDLDGVMADHVPSLMAVHQKPWPFVNGNVGDAAWFLTRAWDLTSEQLWAPCGYEFWSSLPKTPEADDVLDTLIRYFGRFNICFLSSPVTTPGCVEGKRAWCQRHYPTFPLLLAAPGGAASTPPKRFLAHGDALLIDDNGPNVVEFTEAGGRAFLFPRPWNSRHADEGRAVDLLRREVEFVASTARQGGCCCADYQGG